MAASASTTNSSEPQLSKLDNIRKNSGKADTIGLRDSEISKFLSSDSSLVTAIDEAHDYHLKIREEFGADLLMKSEASLIKDLQNGFVNFYKPATVNQYIAIAAKGPWIITSHGAVVHDN